MSTKVKPVFNFPDSPFEVPVVEIVGITKCLNSRNLAVVDLLFKDPDNAGYVEYGQYVVPIDMFKIGDLAFLVREGYTVDTTNSLFSFLKSRRYAKSKSRRVLITGQFINDNYSQGLVLPVSYSLELSLEGVSVGDNVIDRLDIRPGESLRRRNSEAYSTAVAVGRGMTEEEPASEKWEDSGSVSGWIWTTDYSHPNGGFASTVISPPPTVASYPIPPDAPFSEFPYNTPVDDYQRFVKKTAIFPSDAGIVYTTLALNGEAGELAEKIKKIIRDRQAVDNNNIIISLTATEIEDLVKEAGDVLWYVTAFLAEIGSSLQEAMDKNVAKLKSRQKRGVLNGAGDNR